MSSYQEDQNPNSDEAIIRDIYAMTPPTNHPPFGSSLSMDTGDGTSRDDFSHTSATNSTLMLAGSMIESTDGGGNGVSGEHYDVDSMLHPSLSPLRNVGNGREVLVPVRSVKKEEVESKINAWKNAKTAEIMNRFKCEDAIIKGWESEQVQKSTLRMKQVERKLEEKKARAMEKMENEIANAHRKAEERRATAEATRGTKMARVLEVANLMKAVGRSPVKTFF